MVSPGTSLLVSLHECGTQQAGGPSTTHFSLHGSKFFTSLMIRGF